MLNSVDAIYLILAHDDRESLDSLLDCLVGRNIYVAIPSNAPLSKISIEHKSHPKVLKVKSPANWAGFSIVESTILALKELASNEDIGGQVVMLSGQCLPVKPLAQFEEWLASDTRRIISNAIPLSTNHRAWGMSMKRVQRFYFFDYGLGFLESLTSGALSRVIRKVSRTFYVPRYWNASKFPTPYVGSQWMSFPVSVANEIVQAYELGWFSPFKGTFAPDESAIQSFLAQERFINSTRGPLGSLKTDTSVTTVAGLANYHWLRPEMWGYLNLDEIREAAAGQFFFARKIRSTSDDTLICAVRTMIDER